MREKPFAKAPHLHFLGYWTLSVGPLKGIAPTTSYLQSIAILSDSTMPAEAEF